MVTEGPEITLLMTRPPSRSSGRARWMRKKGARTLIAKTRSNSSGVTRSRAPARTAALLTRMSSQACPVNLRSPASSAVKRVSRSPSTPSSARTGKACPPACVIALTTACAASSWCA